MVEDIIKAVNQRFVYVSHDSFDSMLLNCRKKLLNCSFYTKGKFKAFFDCAMCDEVQLIELLDTCESVHTLFLGFVKNTQPKEISVYTQRIHAGEEIVLNEDTMILQDIPQDCYVKCYGDLIVAGTVEGCIDMQYTSLKCIAAAFICARICIFESGFHNVTSFSNCAYYYEEEKLKKEEKPWEFV